MIISNKLSQFKNKKILLLVSSKQGMRIYETTDDKIEKVKEFEAVLPSYSDNEGHFKVRSQGKIMKSGSVRETKDFEVISKFIKKIKEEIKYFKASKYEYVYLYCPSHTKNLITEALPVTFRDKIDHVLEGNYYSKTPLFLLSKLPNLKPKKKPLTKSLEARKILEKSRKARRVIKGAPDRK